MYVDYKVIADAYEAGGYASLEEAEAALSALTVPDTGAEVRLNRLGMVNVLGAAVGLTALEAVYDRIAADVDLSDFKRKVLYELIESEQGLDIANTDSQALLSKWQAAATGDAAAAIGALINLGKPMKPVYPGLDRGQIATALDKRARGVI